MTCCCLCAAGVALRCQDSIYEVEISSARSSGPLAPTQQVSSTLINVETGKSFDMLKWVSPSAAAKIARLRLESSARQAVGRIAPDLCPKRIVFMHIPKTAGTSAKDYLMACVGSRKSGRSVTLTDNFWNEPVRETDLRRANRARFVNGHFSWDVFQQISTEDAVTFTTVGPAAERLWSLFYTIRATRPKLIRSNMADMYEQSYHMSPEEYLKLPDERILYLTNNAVVRQLASSFDDMPETVQGWEQILGLAKANLRKFNYVCFKETFDKDFERVLRDARLPASLPIGKRNVTQDSDFKRASKALARKEFIESAASVIEPLIHWDRKLFEFAKAERAAGNL